MRHSLLPMILAAAALADAAAAQPLTFTCRHSAEVVVTVTDAGKVESVMPKVSQPLPIRVVVQPNFTRTGQTSGTASILDDRGQRKERFEGTIELGKGVDAQNGTWRLDLKTRTLRLITAREGSKATFSIYRCGEQQQAPKPAESVTFRCEDGTRVVAVFQDGSPPTVALEFAGDRRVLPLTRSGSGARYADKGYVFWNKGRQAIFTTPKRETTCIVQP